METKFKKRGVLLSALVIAGLLAMAVNVAGDTVVLGKEPKEKIDEKYAQGKGDGMTLSSFAVPITKSTFSTAALPGGDTAVRWTVSTDLYNYFMSPAPRLYTFSKSRGWPSGKPYDIDKIGVRGRVWKNDAGIFDKTDMRLKSADASVSWTYSCPNYYCGGTYLGRGDHTMVNRGFVSNYPTTYDKLVVGFI